MVAGNARAIWFRDRFFGYGDACEIARSVLEGRSQAPVEIHLAATDRTSTAALAKLIALRRDLLRGGRDLRIVGLSGPARALHEINRLGGLLPLA